MNTRNDIALSQTLTKMCPPGLLAGLRRVDPGDALLPAEVNGFARAHPETRQRAAAARMIARALLARAGHPEIAFPRSHGQPPRWPAGILGSMSHAPALAVAAIASNDHFAGIGIDVEPNAELPADLAAIVLTAQEAGHGARSGRLVFAIKEAVFKATNPLDGIFLDFADIVVDFATKIAVTATGHHLHFATTASDHIIALAWLPRAGSDPQPPVSRSWIRCSDAHT